MNKIIKSLTPSELFDLGWFFANAVRNGQMSTGLIEREFVRHLSTNTGNDKIDKILIHIASKIKLSEGYPFVFAKKELYKLLSEVGT